MEVQLVPTVPVRIALDPKVSLDSNSGNLSVIVVLLEKQGEVLSSPRPETEVYRGVVCVLSSDFNTT